jgi:hypothetical protein
MLKPDSSPFASHNAEDSRPRCAHSGESGETHHDSLHQTAHSDLPTAQSIQRRAHEALTGHDSAADDTGILIEARLKETERPLLTAWQEAHRRAIYRFTDQAFPA